MNGNGIKSWSPSRLFDYEVCPLQTKYKSVDKLCPACFQGQMIWVDNQEICDTCHRQPESSPALENGTQVHEAAEMYITGRRDDIDPRLEKVTHWMMHLRAEYKEKRVRVELMLAVDRNWQPCDWKSPNGYCRTKIDVLWLFQPRQVLIIDWKTGKLKFDRVTGAPVVSDQYADQLNIYSTMILSHGFGDAAQAQLTFTDYGHDVDHPHGTVELATLEENQKAWDRRAKAMMSDTVFAPAPGFQCRWCPYSANNGGPCEY